LPRDTVVVAEEEEEEEEEEEKVVAALVAPSRRSFDLRMCPTGRSHYGGSDACSSPTGCA
jgi:hypothetical protein